MIIHVIKSEKGKPHYFKEASAGTCAGTDQKTKDHMWRTKEHIMHVKGQACYHCGDEISAHHYLPVGHCFGCYFWFERVEAIKGFDENEFYALAKNIYASNDTGKVEDCWTLYHYHEGHFTGRWLGSGGRKITFTYEDGTERSSNNVGCRGDVPERFMKYFEPFKAQIKSEF